jgi:anti-sigma-K factor RskA
MDCHEAIELVDAYAIGALQKKEAASVDRHVQGCLSCWEELQKSQRTASLLAVSVPIEEARPELRERIFAQVRREGIVQHRPPLLERLWPRWRTAVRAASAAGVAALVFAAFLQVQTSDLRGDKNQLQEMLSTTSSELDQQKQIVAVLSASDNRKISMQPVSLSSEAEGVYNWSRDSRAGFVVCNNFPTLPAERVYQVWFTTADMVEPVATFVPQDGACQIPMDMSRVNWRPEGIGISIEPVGGSAQPSGSWFAYATFERTPEGGSGGRRGGGTIDALLAVGP